MIHRHAAILMLAAPLLAAPHSPSNAAGLEALRGKALPVLVFTPRHGDRRMIDQLANLTVGASALAERDMPIFVVTGSDAAPLVAVGADVEPDGAALRRTYGVGDDAFAVVLVGKDGGEKLKSEKPVDASRLTGLVDAMPMRRRETQPTGSAK